MTSSKRHWRTHISTGPVFGGQVTNNTQPGACDAGTNIALNRPCAADSEWNATDYQCARAFNGSTTDNGWDSTGTALPHWLRVDLGSERVICRADVYRNDITWSVGAFYLQWSNDGINFTTIPGTTVSSVPPQPSFATVTLSPYVSARYLRMYITANNGYPTGETSVGEFVVNAGTMGGAAFRLEQNGTTVRLTNLTPVSQQLRLKAFQ